MQVIDLKHKLDALISRNPSFQYIDVVFSDDTPLADIIIEDEPGREKPSLFLIEEVEDV